MDEPMINMNNVIDAPNIVCECGCKTFIQGSVLKRVSKIITMTGKDEIIPIPVFVCSECGKVPNYYKENAHYSRIFGETDGTEPKTEEKPSGIILNN